ncbi:ABC transporter substrate-binding protein [Ruania albidiflava]|uniref:ABC transporter substrate-binding protein n=1 Tax=Ruania albidiflava TaxID=366586 RepID=UPI00041056EB|nr:ABC transporter substrate-binding protein [Ruania albidiflava]
MINRRIPALLGTAALLSMSVAACAANTSEADSEGGSGGDTLEIVSWWTSGSEAAALQVLFDAVQEQDPGLDVVNAAVSGGGGSNAKQALNARLQAGDPPDSWQLHPDGELTSYVAGGNVADVSDLWEENGWAGQMPADLAALQQVDDAYYTVPVGVHRGNVLWTNPSVLDDAGVSIDAEDSLDDLVSALEEVDASGTTAVCLGDKDIFAAGQLLESIIISSIGPENWNGLFTGEYPFDSPDVRTAVETYGHLLELANSDHSALTWDEAALKMADGDCAVTLMGDWAYGELVNAGNEPSDDFAWVPFPSTQPTFVYVGDGFSLPADNISNEGAAELWLTTVMDPQVQTDFAVEKGSIPALSTADVSVLSDYQQSAAEDFQSLPIVSSLAHGQVTTAELSQEYADAVTAFNGNTNVDAFISTMAAAQQSQLD